MKAVIVHIVDDINYLLIETTTSLHIISIPHTLSVLNSDLQIKDFTLPIH